MQSCKINEFGSNIACKVQRIAQCIVESGDENYIFNEL